MLRVFTRLGRKMSMSDTLPPLRARDADHAAAGEGDVLTSAPAATHEIEPAIASPLEAEAELLVAPGDAAEIAPVVAVKEPEPVIVWIDLVNPTIRETRDVESRMGLSLPTRDEMEEIELSSRLYREDGAEFMTMTAISRIESDQPSKTALTFVLKGPSLITIRYAEPQPFDAFMARLLRGTIGVTQKSMGETVMVGLIEAMIDRMADGLERTSNEIDAISREVFSSKTDKASKKTHDLQSLIGRIGRQGDFLTLAREFLISISRLTAYHSALEGSGRKMSKDLRQRIKLIQRDAASLGEQANFMSGKINFLLDATLGLINLEQNQIIKIFTVASVAFLPPTLVASMYGMNFDIMPELHWAHGYPWAIGVMIASATVPLLYFRRRGWI